MDDLLDDGGYNIIAEDHYKNIEHNLWLQLGNSMRKNHRSVFNDHIKFVNNCIKKTYEVVMLHYTKILCEIHVIICSTPLTSKKGREYP